MPNTDPQAIKISNERIRPIADLLAELYNAMKAAQISYTAEDWNTKFPADNEVIVDGSAIDGRTPITNNDVRTFMLTDAVSIITSMETSANAMRNRVFKIAVRF